MAAKVRATAIAVNFILKKIGMGTGEGECGGGSWMAFGQVLILLIFWNVQKRRPWLYETVIWKTIRIER